MTFDEIQKIIEQMLAVQRELQESQLKLQESQQEQRQQTQAEIQSLITGQQNLLSGQRELQESQLNQHQTIRDILIAQQEQRRLLDRLIGYSLTNESDHLTLHERMDRLEERMRRMGRDNA